MHLLLRDKIHLLTSFIYRKLCSFLDIITFFNVYFYLEIFVWKSLFWNSKRRHNKRVFRKTFPFIPQTIRRTLWYEVFSVYSVLEIFYYCTSSMSSWFICCQSIDLSLNASQDILKKTLWNRWAFPHTRWQQTLCPPSFWVLEEQHIYFYWVGKKPYLFSFGYLRSTGQLFSHVWCQFSWREHFIINVMLEWIQVLAASDR